MNSIYAAVWLYAVIAAGAPVPESGISIPTAIPTALLSAMPSFSLPTGGAGESGFSMPSFSLPTGGASGLGGLSGFSIPTEAPTAALKVRQDDDVWGVFTANGITFPWDRKLARSAPTDAPAELKERQFGLSDFSLPTGGFGGLTGFSLPTAIPTGFGGLKERQFSIPTGLGGGLSGFSIPTGIPTGGFGGLSDFSIPTAIPTGFGGLKERQFSIPTGLAGGLSGFSIPTGIPTGGFGGLSDFSIPTAIPTAGLEERQFSFSIPTAGFSIPSFSGFGAAATATPAASTTTSEGTNSGASDSDFSSSTQNDLTNNSGCKKVSLIFARGTSETGNMGSVVGPPLASDLASAIGSSNLAVQGVTYGASVEGAVEGGDSAGTQTMVTLANNVAKSCPSTQIVLSGYSQGAQLVHKAGSGLSSAAAKLVKAAVVFGDPDKGQAITNIPAANVDTFCADGDDVCNGEFVITSAHLSYGSDAPAAATFIKGKVTV